MRSVPCGKRRFGGNVEICSINSAAVKHIMLHEAFIRPGSFSEASAAQSDEMMRDVFRKLSDESSASVLHSFLVTGNCG